MLTPEAQRKKEKLSQSENTEAASFTVYKELDIN